MAVSFITSAVLLYWMSSTPHSFSQLSTQLNTIVCTFNASCPTKMVRIWPTNYLNRFFQVLCLNEWICSIWQFANGKHQIQIHKPKDKSGPLVILSGKIFFAHLPLISIQCNFYLFDSPNSTDFTLFFIFDYPHFPHRTFPTKSPPPFLFL